MSAALKSINGGNQQGKKPTSEDKTIRPHCKAPIEDIDWVLGQAPSVQQLYLECIRAEQYGGAAHELKTNLTYKSFQKASAILSAQGIFEFEELFGRLPSGRPGLIGYRVRNLHGYYNRFYWESSTSPESNSCDEKHIHAGEKINHAKGNQNHPGVEQIHADLELFQKNGQKSEDLQGFQNPNNVANNYLTTYQQPTKVVGMVVGSDAPAENLPVDETAHAPLGGASPQSIESASEQKDSPMATDCTTLALVDAASSQPAMFAAESQNSGVEVRDCHEGESCAGTEELTQSEIFEWLDRADVGECPPLWVIQYLLDSKYYASMRATLSKFEKRWNVSVVNYQVQKLSEAMPTTVNHAARSKARPLRMEKLKMALMVGGDKPDFDFLQECWNDDPALRIIIKQMIAKYPAWGIVCVDGELVNWSGD
jgi:hypothetical protein